MEINYNSIEKQLEKKNKKTVKKILKSNIINIDSNNRQKTIKLITEPLNGKIATDGIKILNNYKVQIYHPNHGMQPNIINQIILTNIQGEYKTNKYLETIGGVPLKYLNYNNDNGFPIHSINIIPKYINNQIQINPYTNLIESDYYILTIKNDIILDNIIINSIGGGNNINVLKVIDTITGYKYASHFKINLGKTFRNIIQARLISIEMSNTQLAIRNKKPDNEVDDTLVLKENFNLSNDTIYWINEEDKAEVYDIIYLNDNRINNSLILTDNTEYITSEQQIQGNSITNFIINNLNNIYIPNSLFNNYLYWPTNYYRNFNTNFLEYIKIFITNKLETILLNEKINILDAMIDKNIPITIENPFLNNLNNTTTINELIIFITSYIITIPETSLDTIVNIIKDVNDTLITNLNPPDVTIERMLYKYLNKTSQIYNLYNYYINLNIKEYSGYWEIKNNISNPNYYIEDTITNIGNIKITPMIENTEDEYKLISTKTINSVNIYNIYPIYKIIIDQGTYTNKSFIEETQKKFNSVQKQKYNYNKQLFINELSLNKFNINVKDEYPTFVVDLNDNKNTVEIKQYKDIFYYSSLDIVEDDEQGPFIINEGYTNIFIKHKEHGLKTGDQIYIQGSSNLSNIQSGEINKEHVIVVNKVYKCFVRLMLAIPETSDLLNNGLMSNTDTNNSYYFYHGYKLIDYASYKSGNAPNYLGSQLVDNTANIFKINELIVKIDELTNTHNISIGRICQKNSANSNGNYEISYTLLSENNFKVGDILVSSVTNTVAMIIPEDYGDNINSHEIGLPTYDELQLLNNDIQLINNGSSGYSIFVSTVPNKSELNGVGGTNVNIRKPINFALLFNKADSPYSVLGFNNEMTNFSSLHSNTKKVNEAFIEYSYLEGNYSNINNDKRYLIIKTKNNVNYSIGTKIYIDNHKINVNLLNEQPTYELQIDTYESFDNYLNKYSEKEKENIETWINNNYEQFYIPNTSGFNYIQSDIYLKTRVVIYYIVPYFKQQIQDLGNLGRNIEQYNNTNLYDKYLETMPNIYGINKDSYIYIYKNSKKIRSLDDVNGEGNSCGLPDGFYKVIGHLPLKNDEYTYFNFYNKSMNALIIDFEFADTSVNNITSGFLNRGLLRAPAINTNIVGIGKTHTNINTIFSLNKTKGTKLITIPRNDAINFNKGDIVILNGLYIDNINNFIDNELSRDNINTIELNIVESITDDIDNNYSIMRLKYSLIYDHNSNEIIYKYNYISFIKEEIVSGTNIIKVENTIENINNFTIDKIVKIDWNKQVSSMTTSQKDYYIEDINYITNINIDNDNNIIEVTLKYNIINNHVIGTNILVLDNKVENSHISTQLVYINNNWYTRIFYNGIRNIYDRQYDGSGNVLETSTNIQGLPYFNPYLNYRIYIKNNNGYYIPNINLESSNIINDNIDIVMPIPNNYYNTYTYNESDLIYKDVNASIPINGIFINDQWKNNSDNDIVNNYFINYNSITIKGKYNGFSGNIGIEYEAEDNYCNNHNGFIIRDIKQDINNKTNIIKLNLLSNNLNINNPPNLLTNIELLSYNQQRNYKIGYGGSIYQKQIINKVDVQGDKYIYLSIKHLDNIITNEFTTSETAFAKLLLNSKIGNNIFNSFINTQKQFVDGALSELDEIEVKFFNDNGKLYDFNNQEVSFTIELITEEEILETINIDSHYL